MADTDSFIASFAPTLIGGVDPADPISREKGREAMDGSTRTKTAVVQL